MHILLILAEQIQLYSIHATDVMWGVDVFFSSALHISIHTAEIKAGTTKSNYEDLESIQTPILIYVGLCTYLQVGIAWLTLPRPSEISEKNVST